MNLSKWLAMLLVVSINSGGVEQQLIQTRHQAVNAQEDLGQFVVRHLTARYADTAVGCDDFTKPAYLCSGIVFRGTRDSLEQPVWDTADKDATRGAVTFAYMRADAKFKTVINGYSNGFIFKAYDDTPGKLHPQAKCFFPMGADTNARAEQGCGAHSSNPQSGPCHVSGITTAEQWWTHFQNEAGSNIAGQCGFSLTQESEYAVYHDFAAGISAMELAGDTSFTKSNELLLAPWGNGQGKNLPLEAFFYVAGSTTGRDVAKRNQQDLHSREGVLIPVVKITLPQTRTDVATFAYSPDDQALPMPVMADLGEVAAASLTARYADTAMNCGSDSKPAFGCSGILLRGTGKSPTYHVWENSPASIARGGVSFSYLRSDAKYNSLAWSYTSGFLFNAYSRSGGYLPEVLCFFPADAGSEYRSDKGCGQHINYENSGPCHLQGVVTAEQWGEHYLSDDFEPHNRQCGFDVSQVRDALAGPAFMEGLQAMKYTEGESHRNNEIILKVWENGLGKVLPLQAFFYLTGSEGGLKDARRNQEDLFATDNVIVPVIQLKLPQTMNEDAVFTYIAEDQTLPMPIVPMQP